MGAIQIWTDALIGSAAVSAGSGRKVLGFPNGRSATVPARCPPPAASRTATAPTGSPAQSPGARN